MASMVGPMSKKKQMMQTKHQEEVVEGPPSGTTQPAETESCYQKVEILQV